MASEWRRVALSALTESDAPVTYGVVKPGPEDPHGVLFIRGGDIADGRVLTSQLRTITREVSDQYRRTQLRGGELVVSLVGNPGQVAIVPEALRGANIARQAGLVRLRKDVDARFVKYFLSSKAGQDALGAHALGSVQSVINLRDLKTVEIPLPPLDEQRRIADVLGTLDDKIELNRRMSETLEAMAQALFKSWFVDFEPVRAKAEGRVPWLPRVLADLFPDSLEDSELGEIPSGWGVRTVEAVCSDVVRGVTPKYEKGSGRLIINQRVNRGPALDKSELKELASDLAVPADRFAKRWDVLVNCLGEGTLGRVHLFKGDSDVYAIDQHMSICRGAGRGVGAFLYQYLASPGGQERIESLKSGSTGMTMFNISKLRNFQILWPRGALIEAYFRLAEPWHRRAHQCEDESEALSALRTALLPGLLSGEIRRT
ncbi:MAG: restriction endonuclease subunit S [Thermoanaerobaculia bacterium]|nr:restriction endonuclease subunit S [Thermoanaerobaculia bacterium]